MKERALEVLGIFIETARILGELLISLAIKLLLFVVLGGFFTILVILSYPICWVGYILSLVELIIQLILYIPIYIITGYKCLGSRLAKLIGKWYKRDDKVNLAFKLSNNIDNFISFSKFGRKINYL